MSEKWCESMGAVRVTTIDLVQGRKPQKENVGNELGTWSCGYQRWRDSSGSVWASGQ